MTQLWLNGKRMDSVALLRSYLGGCSEEERGNACAELLRKYQSGVLSLWLSRQSECAPPRSRLEEALFREKARSGDASNLHLGELAQNAALGGEELITYLSEMCEVERSVVEAAVEEVPRDGDRRREKERLIRKQSWYQSSEPTRILFEAIDWSLVAIDSDDFAQIVGLLSRAPNGGARQPAIYLCNTGGAFVISRPGLCHNVRIVGYGNPTVSFGAANRGETLDMQATGLYFEGFRLNAQGMILQNAARYLKNVEVF